MANCQVLLSFSFVPLVLKPLNCCFWFLCAPQRPLRLIAFAAARGFLRASVSRCLHGGCLLFFSNYQCLRVSLNFFLCVPYCPLWLKPFICCFWFLLRP